MEGAITKTLAPSKPKSNSRISTCADITERKRSEQALRASETRFRSLYNSMLEGVCLHELVYDDRQEPIDYRIIDVNPQYENILGLTSDQVIGRLGSELYDADPPPFLDVYAEVARTGKPATFEAAFAPMQKWFAVSAFCPGKNQFATVFEDVTEQRLAERALRDSEETLRTLLENLSDAVFVHDLHGRFLLVNAAAVRQTGYTRAELETLTVADIDPRSIPRGDHEVFWNATMAGKTQTFEAEHRRKDGTTYPVEVTLNMIELKGASVVLAVARDITDRKRSEQCLRDVALRQELAVKGGKIGLWDWDLINNQVYYSDEWKEQIGCQPDEIGDGFEEWSSRIHPDDLDQKLAEIHECIAHPGNIYEVEFRFRHKSGEYRWILASASVQADEDGRPLRMVGTHVDITELKQAELAMREAEKIAATGKFAAQIAHEINNPLAGIKNSFRLIRDAVPQDHPDRDMVERIEREIDRIAHVVRQMYKLHAPKTSETVEVAVHETITDVVMMLEPLCRQHEVSIDIAQAEAGLSVHVPTGCLHQILYNLLANAVQASPHSGQVKLAAEADDKIRGWVHIRVEDHGVGIPRHVQKRMFEPFFSGAAECSGKESIGLGLSIVRNMIDLAKGRIEFASKPGIGTRFDVYLPSG